MNRVLSMNTITCLVCGRLNPRMVFGGVRNGINRAHVRTTSLPPILNVRSITSTVLCQAAGVKGEPEDRLVSKGYFASDKKNKENFKAACEIFKGKAGDHRRGYVEFIYAALKYMEEFGVHKDLELYKSLVDLMPKGKLIPTNMWQAEFMHYPKQQQCAVDLLEQMEVNAVMPDSEMQNMLTNIFGKYSDPVKKFSRMMYWMPKFKHASPWSLPEIVPNDAFELAKLAVSRMCSVDPSSKITMYETKDVEDAIDDDTWIVSGMSPIQEELIQLHPIDEPLKVEGPFRIYLREECVSYFILRGEGKPPLPPVKREEIDDVKNIKHWFTDEIDDSEHKALTKKLSVHEQEDGTIMAICATGTSSRDSLLSWIRQLQGTNPNLTNIPVLFTQASPIGEVMTVEEPASGEVKTTP